MAQALSLLSGGLFSRWQPGDLSISGFLYEGNFASWDTCMVALLSTPFLNKRNDNYDTRQQRKSDLLRANVSDCVLSTTPSEAFQILNYKDLSKLVRILHERTTSFRFVDLPPLVQERILRFVILDATQDVQYVNSPCRGSPLEIPPITQVSRAVRSESLAMFWTSLKVLMGQDHSPERREGNVSRLVNKWAEKLGPTRARCLKMLAISLMFEYKDDIGERGSTEICLRFDPNAGLTVDKKIIEDEGWDQGDWSPITPLSFELLETHLANISKTARLLGLRGEALILAFTSRPELWESHLRYLTLGETDVIHISEEEDDEPL